MSRPRNVVPSYLHHRATGQAYVRLGPTRKVVYLGPYNSEVSRQEYARIVGEAAVCAARVATPTASLTVNELLAQFKEHAEAYYRRPDGTPTSEVSEYAAASRMVRALYGPVPAAEFGPLAIRAVRERMLAAGWARKTINDRTARVKRIWKWAAAGELVPFAVYHALTAMVGLRKGRTTARETKPVRPVADAVVDATLPCMPRHVRGLVRFQRYTGCRPGEAVLVRPCDLDMSGELWVFRPHAHKNDWRGHDRSIVIGPKARAVLDEFTPPGPTDYYFSPARCMAERKVERRAKRKTPVQPSQVNRAVPDPQRPPGERYTTAAYDKAVTAACLRAGVERWSPNQLRHAHGTMVRKQFGLEAAGATLGHIKMSATQIYAARDAELAARVAREVG